MRRIETYEGRTHFAPELPVFVNRWTEGFELAQHRHDFVELCCVAEGRGHHYLDDKVVPAERGDVFVLPVGCSHVLRPGSSAPRERLVVYNCAFAPELPAQIASNLGVPVPFAAWLEEAGALKAPVVLRDPAGEWEALFEELHREYALRRVGYEAAVLAGLARLLTRLHRRTLPADAADAPIPRGLDDTLLYIRKNCALPLTAAGMARMSNLSLRHFHRVFRQYTGQTFAGYLLDRRIEKGCALLRETVMPVAAVARESGYRDAAYFREAFAAKMGVTPSAYRKNMAKDS